MFKSRSKSHVVEGGEMVGISHDVTNAQVSSIVDVSKQLTVTPDPFVQADIDEIPLDKETLYKQFQELIEFWNNDDYDKYENAMEFLEKHKYDLELCNQALEDIAYQQACEIDYLVNEARRINLIRYETAQSVVDLYTELGRDDTKVIAVFNTVWEQENQVRKEAKYSEFLSRVGVATPGYNKEILSSTETLSILQERINALQDREFFRFEVCCLDDAGEIEKYEVCERKENIEYMREFRLSVDAK